MNSKRDTQFTSSARHVIERLPEFPNLLGYTLQEWREEATTLLAQYAYDLVSHVIEHAPPGNDTHDWDIPDLTKWPERKDG